MRMRMSVRRNSSGSWARISFADTEFVDVDVPCDDDDGGQNEGRFSSRVAFDIAQMIGGFLAGCCVGGEVVPGTQRDSSWCHRPGK